MQRQNRHFYRIKYEEFIDCFHLRYSVAGRSHRDCDAGDLLVNKLWRQENIDTRVSSFAGFDQIYKPYKSYQSSSESCFGLEKYEIKQLELNVTRCGHMDKGDKHLQTNALALSPQNECAARVLACRERNLTKCNRHILRRWKGFSSWYFLLTESSSPFQFCKRVDEMSPLHYCSGGLEWINALYENSFISTLLEMACKRIPYQLSVVTTT
ncbi:hypothetical protein EGR_06312 [Echinococcus granulosus]|uniref:Uncharacterized protein n=1 Tax=Echinococcus granulosus TaxID=6210 RepID=W6UBX2_ECHGR|nr:hypothetical protein EGR_06312 [Echinococcus granulosus]EUB58888.1 hypothetical protein EGR_06312 [Echinococcus granulosus]